MTVVVLLALSDEGAPAYDHAQAEALAALGVPVVRVHARRVPRPAGAALEGRDVGRWANEHGMHTVVAEGAPGSTGLGADLEVPER